MAKISGLPTGGINPTGYGANEGFPYEITSRTKKKLVLAKLRVGETVQGKIVGVPAKNQAVVRLPIGTLRARIEGSLKAGDSLFLNVVKTAPSLELKIKSAPTAVDGRPLPTSEILRILDLPDNPFFSLLADFMRMRRSIISRDELLFFSFAFAKINEDTIKKTPPEAMFKALLFFLDSKIEFSASALEKVLPAFLGSTAAREVLLKLESALNSFPPEIANQIKKLLEKVKSGKAAPGEVFNLFRASEKSGGLYKILIDFLDSTPKSGEDRARESAKSFVEFAEAVLFANAASGAALGTSKVFFPMYRGADLFVIAAMLGKSKNESGDEESSRFSFEIDSDELGKSGASGSLSGDLLSAKLFSETETGREVLEKDLKSLLEKLKDKGYRVSGISVASPSGDELSYGRSDQTGSKNISVVI